MIVAHQTNVGTHALLVNNCAMEHQNVQSISVDEVVDAQRINLYGITSVALSGVPAQEHKGSIQL